MPLAEVAEVDPCQGFLKGLQNSAAQHVTARGSSIKKLNAPAVMVPARPTDDI